MTDTRRLRELADSFEHSEAYVPGTPERKGWMNACKTCASALQAVLDTEGDRPMISANPDVKEHASAPVGQRCADCQMDGEACPLCYAAWWKRRHPNTIQLPVADTEGIMKALANSGIDTTCGACMEVAFTGMTTAAHSCRRADTEGDRP